jgi:hypothetical protein
MDKCDAPVKYPLHVVLSSRVVLAKDLRALSVAGVSEWLSGRWSGSC